MTYQKEALRSHFLKVFLAEQSSGQRKHSRGMMVSALFSETQSRFLLSVKKEHQAERFERLGRSQANRRSYGLCSIIKVTMRSRGGFEATVEELKDAWKGAIPCLLK